MKTLMENLTVFGDPIQVNALEQIKACLKHPDAIQGALMADHHKGYSMPIGGVVAYQDAVSPTGVGFDIACGNKCVKTNLFLSDLMEHPSSDKFSSDPLSAVKPIMREIQRKVEFGVGRKNQTPHDHAVLDQYLWPEIEAAFGSDLRKKAAAQLGTVGSGNHYVDLLVDSEGALWVANHFGSRGLGHTIASGFMAKAAGRTFRDKVPETEDSVVLPTTQALGQFYIEAMELAGEYAYAGRDYVIEQVLTILGANAVFEVHNHHNFAWFEDGFWVVRKGATPLTTEPAFIGGSMGDSSVIVRGLPGLHKDAAPIFDVMDLGNIGSAPHGAGRVMSRTQAAGKMRHMWSCNNRDCGYMIRKLHPEHTEGDGVVGSIEKPELCPWCGGTKFSKQRQRDVSTAEIDWAAVRLKLQLQGIVVLGAGADEAPGVYKSLMDVIGAHPNIEILHELHPLGVVMAGPDEFDPYKD